MTSSPSTQILIVEDDENDSYLLTRQIASAQIEELVTVITTGEEALQFLREQTSPPLACFVDIRLPGMSGIELLTVVRAEPTLKNIPVIIMTGSCNPNDATVCHQLGVTAFLEKPIGLSTFIKTVAHLFPEKSGRGTKL